MARIPITFIDQSIRTRICEYCNNIITIYPSDIARGKGMFCSKSCAAKRQNVEKFEKICKFCGSPFKTIKESTICCCNECLDEYNKIQP